METYVFKSSEGDWFYSVPTTSTCTACPANHCCSDRVAQQGISCVGKRHYEKIPHRLFQEGDIIYWKDHKYYVRSDVNRSGKLCYTCPFHGSCVGKCYCGIGLYVIPAETKLEDKSAPAPNLEYQGDLKSSPWFASVEAEFLHEMDRQNQLNILRRMHNMRSYYPMVMGIDPIYPTSPKPPDKTNSRSRRASLKPNINPITPLKWKTKNKKR